MEEVSEDRATEKVSVMLTGSHLPQESCVSLNSQSEMVGFLASSGVTSSSFPKAGVQSSPSTEPSRKENSDKH